MLASNWYIVVGGAAFFGTIATVLAYRRRSFVDVLIVGIVLVGIAMMWNSRFPPFGAIFLSALFILIMIGSIVSGLRSKIRRKVGPTDDPGHSHR
jgi:predicted MFS family arabinose efflux permease